MSTIRKETTLPRDGEAVGFQGGQKRSIRFFRAHDTRRVDRDFLTLHRFGHNDVFTGHTGNDFGDVGELFIVDIERDLHTWL